MVAMCLPAGNIGCKTKVLPAKFLYFIPKMAFLAYDDCSEKRVGHRFQFDGSKLIMKTLAKDSRVPLVILFLLFTSSGPPNQAI